MSHFYGTLKGNRGAATRAGAKSSGLTTIAASWSGAISVHLYHDKETGRDCFSVSQMPWCGVGAARCIAQGYVGETVPGETLVPKAWEAGT